MSGRVAELNQLTKLYEENGNQIAFLYGRDHMGKMDTIREFCKGKKHFFYDAREASSLEQKRMMSHELQEKLDIKFPIDEYDQIFNRIKSGDPSKFVLVIHHVDRILRKSDELMVSLRKLLNRQLYPGPVMVLLCTSSVAWAQKDFKEEVDLRLKCEEINFLELVRMFPDASVRQSVEIYGILGGVPGYLERWNKQDTIRTNVCNNILSSTGFLYHEAERFIGSELRELSVYSTILGALAKGIEKLNDLYHDTGFSRAKISVYMKNLMAFDVIEKITSIETGGWDNAKKGIYRIKNTFVSFWFRFVYPHLSDLSLLKPEDFYDTYIEKDLQTYLNQTFVKVCMEYLELTGKMNQLPIRIQKMGTWEGKKGTIDIVAQNAVRESVVAICNWSEPEVTGIMYLEMEKNLELAKLSPKLKFVFTAGRFGPDLQRMAGRDNTIKLIDMNRL